MEVQIRKADISELDLLIKWRMEVLREVFPASEYEFPKDLEEENRKYYKWAIPAEKHIACFACADGEIIGCGGLCLYQEMPSPDNPSGQCAYLMNIYCRPPYRRMGVGKAIICWLTDQAKQKNISKIYLETSDAARKLYEEIGFTQMKDIMILPK